MLKLQVRRWSERPRIMVLMLAVMLPALALIVFGAVYLRRIQRDKAIEAAFQRDYQHVLAIAEKRIDERAYDGAEETRSKFPDVDNPEELDTFLTKSPSHRACISVDGERHVCISISAQPAERSSLLCGGCEACFGPWEHGGILKAKTISPN